MTKSDHKKRESLPRLPGRPCKLCFDPVQQQNSKRVRHFKGAAHHILGKPVNSEFFVHGQDKVYFDENGDPLCMTGMLQDVTARTVNEQVLRQSETRFRAIFEQAAVGMAHINLEGRLIRVNHKFCEILGYSEYELLKSTVQDLTQPSDLYIDLDFTNKLINNECKHYSTEKRYIRKDSSLSWIQLTVSLVRDQDHQPDYFIHVIEDINDRKDVQARLLTSLNEKEALLRELHHRVKNNMQVISSLLSLQEHFSGTKEPKLILQENRQRIHAMALIHERIYDSDNLAAVDFLDYLRDLGERLTRLYHKPGINIKIQVSGEQLTLPVDYALPCALIGNELITNIIQHAYLPTQQERMVEVRISNTESSQPHITFRDYGRGIDLNLVKKEGNTLGLVIVRALVRQLGGCIEFESQNGSAAILSFPLNSSVKQNLI